MAAVIDTSIWVDLFHPKTASPVRNLARDAVNREEAVLCEPVKLELLRGVPDAHYKDVIRYLDTLPVLPSPASLWTDALALARRCFRSGYPVSSMDTLIAATCAAHRAELLTFDRDFVPLGELGGFKVTVLERDHPSQR